MNTPNTSPVGLANGLLRWQFRLMHRLLDTAAEEISAEQSGGRSPDIIARAGACYAQIVLCEDVSVHSMLAVGPPLALTTWAGRTGLSELAPLIGPIDWQGWVRRVRLVDMASLRAYAQAVRVATDAYLVALGDDELDPAHEEPPASLLSALLLTMAMRHGEIASLLSTARRAAPG